MGIACRVIVECENRVLIGKRAPGVEGGKWNIFGGKQDRGEAAMETAKRELWEETGISGTDLMWLCTDKDNGWITYYFLTHLDEFHPTDITDVEHDEMKWVSESELDELQTEFAFNHYLILKHYFDTRDQR